MENLFDKTLTLNMESLLEWAHPRWVFDYSEGYEDEEVGRMEGIFSFVNWPRNNVDREAYTAERRMAWAELKTAIRSYHMKQRTGEVPTGFPKRKRSMRRNRGR